MSIIFYTAAAIGIFVFVAIIAFVILVIVAAKSPDGTIEPICLLTGETCRHMGEECEECVIAEEARKIGDR